LNFENKKQDEFDLVVPVIKYLVLKLKYDEIELSHTHLNLNLNHVSLSQVGRTLNHTSCQNQIWLGQT